MKNVTWFHVKCCMSAFEIDSHFLIFFFDFLSSSLLLSGSSQLCFSILSNCRTYEFKNSRGIIKELQIKSGLKVVSAIIFVCHRCFETHLFLELTRFSDESLYPPVRFLLHRNYIPYILTSQKKRGLIAIDAVIPRPAKQACNFTNIPLRSTLPVAHVSLDRQAWKHVQQCSAALRITG